MTVRLTDPPEPPVVDDSSPGYQPDRVSASQALLRAVASMVAGGALTLVAWYILRSVTLAAFNVSMVTRALATACSVILVATAALLCFLWLRDGRNARPRWRTLLTEAVCSLTPAGLVVMTIGIPLAATKLYLDGIQVDQGFRTQFLTRMTETAANQDMNYVDMPSFYPLGWFWLGGRMANVLGLSGWEVYQPWALVSLAAAASLLVPVWRKLTGSLPVATAVAVVTTAVILTMVPEEPYAAVVAMGVPAAAVMGYRAMNGSWASTAGLTLFLGVSACFYTLFTGITALMMIVFALTSIVNPARGVRAWVPVKHLTVMGLGSMLIALVSWGPYLKAVLTSEDPVNSAAQHFLPSQGTEIPLPFFELTFVGLLSLIGLIYILVRFREPEITYLGIAVSVCYVWVVASMVVSLAATTLLGFRVEVLIALLLSTAGVIALADLRLVGVDRLYPDRLSRRANRVLTGVFVALFALAALSYIQRIPVKNETFIDQAYSNTDGNGERADLRESDVGRYYAPIDQFIQSQGYTPSDTVVLTDEINFMSYHPYHGFNAFTSHYANPLGQFEARNEVIAEWAKESYGSLAAPAAMTRAIDGAPWRAPDAIIFRGTLNESAEPSTSREPNEPSEKQPWKTHVAHDIFPSEPNVRYEALYFNPESFNSPAWTARQFGPFVVVVRNR